MGQGDLAMNAALRATCDAVSLLTSSSLDDVKTRYEVGVIVSEIKSAEQKYGIRTVERLAEALGWSVANLYRHATVAETWSRAEMDELLSKRNSRGQPLLWSHWVFLASVDAVDERARLLDEALSRSLSARELAALLPASTKNNGVVLPSVLRAILAQTEDVTARCEKVLRACCSTQSGADVRDALERAIVALKDAEHHLRRIQHDPRRSGTWRIPKTDDVCGAASGSCAFSRR